MSSLLRVVTIAEVCAIYAVSRSTVIYYIDTGAIAHRRAGNAYVLDVDSVADTFGEMKMDDYLDGLEIYNATRMYSGAARDVGRVPARR